MWDDVAWRALREVPIGVERGGEGDGVLQKELLGPRAARDARRVDARRAHLHLDAHVRQRCDTRRRSDETARSWRVVGGAAVQMPPVECSGGAHRRRGIMHHANLVRMAHAHAGGVGYGRVRRPPRRLRHEGACGALRIPPARRWSANTIV